MSTSHIHILAAIGTNAIDIEAACEDLLALRVHHKPNEYGSDEWSEADHIGIFTSKTTHARRMAIKSWLSPLRKSAKSVDAPSSPQLHGQLLAVEAIDEGRGLFFASSPRRGANHLAAAPSASLTRLQWICLGQPLTLAPKALRNLNHSSVKVSGLTPCVGRMVQGKRPGVW